jgi:hypothetical protein
MAIATCPVCGVEFNRFPSEAKKRITCSRTCAARMFRDKGEVAQCAHCGGDFYRNRFKVSKGHGTTCSRACHFALRRKRVTATCIQCDSPFEVPHYQINVMGGGKFCTRRCTDIFKRKLRKRGEQNMFTNWQKREWKDEQCAKCGATEKLELDHIVPRFAGGTTERTNAQTLCRTCNRKKFWTDDYPLYLTYLRLRAEAC